MMTDNEARDAVLALHHSARMLVQGVRHVADGTKRGTHEKYAEFVIACAHDRQLWPCGTARVLGVTE